MAAQITEQQQNLSEANVNKRRGGNYGLRFAINSKSNEENKNENNILEQSEAVDNDSPTRDILLCHV